MADPFAMDDRPTGTVTILFSDIEGSTRLLQKLGRDEYARLLSEHHRLIRDAVAACRGVEIKTEGDSFFVVFPRAADAITAAVDAQRALHAREWPGGERVSVRMGVHTGDVDLSDGEYVGLDVHRAARISSAAHGGQVLLSEATRALVAAALPDDVSVRELGEHRLKDIDQPEQLHQLVIAGLPSDFPAPHAESTRLDLLPVEMSSFVGRETELARARDLLRTTRLLTLTGPGGTGKTRLAIRLARSVAGEYVDGAAFVPLAAITEPELVLPTIRQALGLLEQPGRSALDTIVERLTHREVLIVLDNFEQVAAAAPAVSSLLQQLPGVSLIVTSRVALRIEGEQEFAVPPLSVPSPTDAADLDRLSAADSIALFVARARSVRPDFALTRENARAIIEICARLDGLPLAIELAASRIKLLPPAALLARLERRLDLLQSTGADRTDRQRTLRGAIDWSYGLLGEPERALFRRLSIFVGGARLEDAEPIVSAADRIDLDLLEGVSALVDQSLVRQVDVPDHLRFGMLETIREFGREQLEVTGEIDATAQAHAHHFATLAAEAEPRLTAGREWLDRLEAEHDNLRAALARLGQRDIQAALLMAGRLWRFWHLRGHLREGAAVLKDLLATPGAGTPTNARAKALIGYAGLVYWQTDYEQARASYEQALQIAQASADSSLEVEILYSLAYVRAIGRDYEGATRDLRAARELYQSAGNELMATWALATIGMVETLAGDHERAIELLEESTARFEGLGDEFGMRNSLSVLLRALMNLGRYDEAWRATSRVSRLALASSDLTALSADLHDAASLAALEGDLERAALLTGAAQRMFEQTGAQPPPELVNRIEAMPILRTQMAERRLQELLADGRRLSDEKAVELIPIR